MEAILLDELENQGIEIIDGEEKEKMGNGFIHHRLIANLCFMLEIFVRKHQLGYVNPDGLIFLMGNTGLRNAFIPDASFISHADMPPDWTDWEKPFPNAPTLAIEVVSPTDDVSELLYKVGRYLDLGTSEVWVIYPRSKEIHRFQASQRDTIKRHTTEETFTAQVISPEFVVAVNDIFALPNMA